MKTKYLFLEFSIIFIFLVIPPLFQGPTDGNSVNIANGGRFSLMIAVQGLISAALICQDSRTPFLDESGRVRKFSTGLSFLIWTPISLGLAMLSQAAFTGLSMLTGTEGSPIPVFPESPGQWTVYFLNLSIGVLFEEAIYRLFLPDALVSLTGGRKKLRIPCEAACIAIFALSHRYMGIMAVMNAAVCGTIFRIARIRSGRIWAPTAAHLIYNAFQTFALYFLGGR